MVTKPIANEESQVLAELRKDQKMLKTAMNTEATSGFASNEEIIERLDLSPGSAKVLKARLVGVRMGRSTKKPAHSYFSFNNIITEGAGKGLVVSRYIGLVARGERTKEDAYKDLSFEFQRSGFATEGMTDKELVDLLKEISKDKPGVMIKVKCYEIKAGPRKGDQGIDVAASRPISEDDLDENEEDTEEENGDEEEDSSDDTDEEDVEESSDDEEESEEDEDSESDGPDIDDPTTWEGFQVIAKPTGTPRKATFTVAGYSVKTKKVTLTGPNGKTYTVKPNEVLNFVEE